MKQKLYSHGIASVLLVAVLFAWGSPSAAWAEESKPADDLLAVESSQDEGEDLSYADGEVWVQGKTSGTVGWEASTRTLTLSNVRAESVYTSLNITLKLVGSNSFGEILGPGSYGAETITITGSGSLNGNVECYDRAIVLAGGTINGSFAAYSLTMSGGSIVYKGVHNEDCGVYCEGPFKMTGGSIQVSNSTSAIECHGSFAVSGGSITVQACDEGIVVNTPYDYERQTSDDYAGTANATISGGDVRITTSNADGECIYLAQGNLTISGGTVLLSAVGGSAITASSETVKGVAYGGTVAITGGGVTAKAGNAAEGTNAIVAKSVTAKQGCLNEAKGKLANGATFKVGGNTYQVKGMGSVILLSYGSSKKTATFSKVKYQGASYRVTGVASNAFNTKQGRKVKTIKFKNALSYVAANAFKGTSALTTVDLKLSVDVVRKSGKAKKIKAQKGTTFSKAAFKGAGKSKGKKLVVRVGYKKVPKASAVWRTWLRKHGLAAKAKVVAK